MTRIAGNARILFPRPLRAGASGQGGRMLVLSERIPIPQPPSAKGGGERTVSVRLEQNFANRS